FPRIERLIPQKGANPPSKLRARRRFVGSPERQIEGATGGSGETIEPEQRWQVSAALDLRDGRLSRLHALGELGLAHACLPTQKRHSAADGSGVHHALEYIKSAISESS